MFDYDLKGKQVILVLDEEVAQRLKPLGIRGSPLLGTVHSVESHGLWLDNPAFSVCPIGTPKLHDAAGETFCHAQIFIPAGGIVSAVAFPTGTKIVEEPPGLHKIGFAPVEERRS